MAADKGSDFLLTRFGEQFDDLLGIEGLNLKIIDSDQLISGLNAGDNVITFTSN